MITDRVPAGFRRSTTTGLIVPEEQSREREVWTRDEWKTIERATKLLAGRGLEFFMRCPHTKDCQAAPMERLRRADGGLELRCAHKTRVVLPRL